MGEDSDKIEQRMIALQDSIQNYREEFDFLYQQKLMMEKRVYELSGSLKTLQMVGEGSHVFDDDFEYYRDKEVEVRVKNDKLQIAVRAKLFKLESKLSPIDVMFLYRIIDGIGELADRAQKVGSRMQLLIAS